jgi:hypothetical protein
MSKVCKFCNDIFFDKTKNQNRSHCGSSECSSLQKREYAKQRNQDKYKASIKKFKDNNPDYLKNWRSNNKERNKELNRKSYMSRYRNNLNFKLAHLLRHRLNQALKGDARIGSHVKYLGCTIEEFKNYLESKFLYGMSWDNYGKHGWHVDHIIPISSFDLQNLDELKKACNFTNLQPLWAKDNWSKGNKNVTV